MGLITIITAKIFVSLFLVSAVESSITISERSSWMSPEFLSHMIEVSLNRSKCTNVHISGDSTTIETIFEDFTRVYPNEYVLMDTSGHCNGHFMISSSVDRVAAILKTVPGKTSTEILIIIDDVIDESSLIFDVSLYGHANVDIVSSNGLRTLSEIFLQPRVFKNVSSYNEIVRKRGLVNFRGRELQASAYYVPPLSYLKTAVNRTINGNVAQVYKNAYPSSTESSELDGAEVNVFLLMARELNFTWTIRTPYHGSEKNAFGHRNGTDWNGGMIGQIYHEEVDIAFSGVWITRDNCEFTSMTNPWGEVSVNFLVPRPKSYRTPWALTTSFSRRVWIYTFVMLTVQTVYVCAKAWIVPGIPKEFRNFIVTLTELMAQLVGNSSIRRMQGLKAHFTLWYFIGILMVTAYSSNLAARLANYGYEPRIDTVENFLAANLTWGGTVPPVLSLHFDESDPSAKRIIELFEVEKDEVERHEKIMRGNYAILGKTIANSFFPLEPVPKNHLQYFRKMRDATAKHLTGFATQPWLLEPVNEMIMRLREAGIIDYHLRDVIARRESLKSREVFVEHDVFTDEPRVLELIPLTVAFIVLVVGLAISSVVFYLELRHASGKTSIFHLLRRIKKKRDNRRDGSFPKDYGIVVLTKLRREK